MYATDYLCIEKYIYFIYVCTYSYVYGFICTFPDKLDVYFINVYKYMAIQLCLE